MKHSCAGALCIALLASSAYAEIGTVGAVNLDMTGTPPEAAPRVLNLGNGVVQNERIETSAVGSGQLMFLDQTTLTVAPSSNIVLDSYIYNPEQTTGEISLSLTRGALRFVGGRITKSREATIRTPTATIGIRGGLTLIEVADDGTTKVIQIAGEYATVNGKKGGAKVTLSRPSASAQVPPDGEATYTGLVTSEDLSTFYKSFEGSGTGSSEVGTQAEQIDDGSLAVAENNSDVPGGETTQPVSTSGEQSVEVTEEQAQAEATSDPAVVDPVVAPTITTNDPTITTIPTAGSVSLSGLGFFSFEDVSQGSLVGTTSVGDTIRLPTPTTFSTTDLQGEPFPNFIAQSQRNAGFTAFDFNSGATSTFTGFENLAGVGFLDFDTNFFLYVVEGPAGANTTGQTATIIFADPALDQSTVLAADSASLAATGNAASFYRIEDGQTSNLEERVAFVTNGGAGLNAVGNRVVSASIDIDNSNAGFQTSNFFVLADEFSQVGTDGGPQLFGVTALSSEGAGFGFGVSDTPLGLVEDILGNTVYGPNAEYLVASSFLRPTTLSPPTETPGSFRIIGQTAQVDVPVQTLLSREPLLDELIADPLPLANDQTSRFLGETQSFIRGGFVNGVAACSDFNCGASLVDPTAPVGFYILSSSDGFRGASGQASANFLFDLNAPTSNTVRASFGLVDDGTSNNSVAGISPGQTNYTITAGFNLPAGSYIDDDRFAIASPNGVTIDGSQAANAHVIAASSALAGDGVAAGIFPAAAVSNPGFSTKPEFLRWGWWSANFEVTNNQALLREDLVHLGTWITGHQPVTTDLPSTGTAQYAGFAVGTEVSPGSSQVVGGDFGLNYDFGIDQGTFDLRIAGSAFNGVGVTGFRTTPDLEYFGSTIDGAGSSANIRGQFFAGGGDPAAATAGEFHITNSTQDRQVIGIFGGDKSLPGVNP